MEGLVVGRTTEREVQVASRTTPFPLNALVKVGRGDDAAIGQVVETFSFNRFLPQGERGPVDPGVLDSLARLGWDVRGDTVHLATVRLLESRVLPVPVGAPVTQPTFDEVAPHFLPAEPDRCFALGVVRGTESVAAEVPSELSQRVPVWRRGDDAARPGNGLPLLLDPRGQMEYPHIGLFGGSGSGKSFALRVLCEEIMQARQPGLVLDPHYELDFSQAFPPAGADVRPFARAHRVAVVGRDVNVDFTRLSTGLLLRLLGAAFATFTGPMEHAVRMLHRRGMALETFRERLEVAKWATTGEPDPSEPREAQRIERLKQQHRDVREMDRQVGGLETLDAVERRLSSLELRGLFGGTGRDAVAWAREALCARQLAVLRGPQQELELVALYVLEELYGQRRDYRDAMDRFGAPADLEPLPPFWVILDEAHRFAPKNPEAPSATRSILRIIAQEGRKYGVFLVAATQRPALLQETITAQLSTKFLFRTVRAQDIETIRDETDIGPEEARRLPYLASGECFVALAQLGRAVPLRVRVPYTAGRSTPDPWAELEQFSGAVSPLAEVLLEMVRNEPGGLRPPVLSRRLDELSARLGREVSGDEARRTLAALAAAGELVEIPGAFGSTYKIPETPKNDGLAVDDPFTGDDDDLGPGDLHLS